MKDIDISCMIIRSLFIFHIVLFSLIPATKSSVLTSWPFQELKPTAIFHTMVFHTPVRSIQLDHDSVIVLMVGELKAFDNCDYARQEMKLIKTDSIGGSL